MTLTWVLRSARRGLVAVAFLLLVLVFVVLVSDWNSQRNAGAMIALARTIRVGETTVPELLQAAGPLQKTMDARKDEGKDRIPVQKVPLNTCLTGSCVISFGPSPVERGFISDLHAKYPQSGRWLRSNNLYVWATADGGIVRGIGALAMSVDDQLANEVAVTIKDDSNAMAWTLRKEGGTFEDRIATGFQSVEIRATPKASTEKIGRAMDFDLGCLHRTRHCSPCEWLPFACGEYEHGDWFYFEMPAHVVSELGSVVHGMRFGTSVREVEAIVGGWDQFGGQRFEDKLPYLFPDGTDTGDRNPKRRIYYVKKRREGTQSRDDRAVIFVFDQKDRLIKIDSPVESIPSRP